MKKLCLLLAALTCVSTLSYSEMDTMDMGTAAEDSGSRFQGFEKLGVGFGVVTADKLYRQDDDNTMFLPMLDVKYGRFYVKGIQVGAYLYESEAMAFSVFLDPLGGFAIEGGDMKSGYKNIDDRDSMAMIGGKLELNVLPGQVKTIVSYKAGEHGGQGDLTLARPTRIGDRLVIVPSAGASIYTSDFADYYFGVDGDEVRESNTDKLDEEYSADVAYSYGAKVTAEYMFNSQLSALGVVGVKQFDSEVEDSPIVENGTIFFGGVGAKYKF